MIKIDRLGWAVGASVESYGVRVGVRTNRPEALDRLVKLFPGDAKTVPYPLVNRLYSLMVGGEGSRPGLRRFNLVYVNLARTARTTDLDEAVEQLESDLHLYLAEWARWRVFVQAGVVGWNGKAILVPGGDSSGKSTLVAEMVRAGATYYSDQYAVLDWRGRVHPFARPIRLRENGGERQTRYEAEDLGGIAGEKPLPVGLVVASEFRATARWRPRRLSPGQGVLALLANTMSARHKPELAFNTLWQVVANVPVLKGVRGEAGEVVDQIFERVA